MPPTIAPCLSQRISNFADLRHAARPLGPKNVAVVGADDEVALTAADGALQLGIALPVLIGDENKIRAQAESLGLSKLIAKAEFISAADAAAVAAHMAGDGQRRSPAARDICAPTSFCTRCSTNTRACAPDGCSATCCSMKTAGRRAAAGRHHRRWAERRAQSGAEEADRRERDRGHALPGNRAAEARDHERDRGGQ